MANNHSKIVADFVILRALVGYLGEKPQFGWWDTNFLSKTSLQFLEINFPRSYLSAGCVSVTQAAHRVHDQLIGKNGVFHLFRLEEAMGVRSTLFTRNKTTEGRYEHSTS